MKKNIVLVLISIFILCSNIASAINEKNEDIKSFDIKDGIISIKIPVGKVEHEKTINGDEISIDDFGRLIVPGKPSLPTKIFSIAIPPGAEFIGLNYKLGEGIVLAGIYDISPVPIPQLIGKEYKEIQFKEEQIYNENYEKTYNNYEEYPASIVEFERTSGFRKYNLVDVRINPITYNPLSCKLTYYPDITFNIQYEIVDGYDFNKIMFDYEESFEQRASEFILNYEEAKDWYLQEQSGRENFDYVIITLDSLTSYINDLVEWEETKGKSVKVVTTTWIDSNYAGFDLAEKMRNFLREKYPSEEWGIQDLLIIGHRDDIPMRLTWQDVGGGKPETDFYYAELSLPDDQSWDANGNHQYGENSDPIDYYGEINVGRIPWSDPDTVQHICEKSVNYEQNNDPSFKNNILLLGAFIDYQTDGAVFMEYMANSDIHPWMKYWMKMRLYEPLSVYKRDYNLNHENVVNAWSSGKFGFVSWHAHGSPNGCEFITVDDCDLLNDDYPAIISAASCSNSDTAHLSIGQAMLKQGGVGFLGANKVAYYRSGWDDPNDGSDQSFKYFFKSCVTSGDYTQGQAHQYAISEMYEKGLWNNLKYETFIQGSLWGNPDLGMKSIYENDPPDKPATPDGPLEGVVGIDYTYSTSTSDPNMENIYYFFDWGDGSNSGWLGPYLTGEIAEASHIWLRQDSYEIKTIAQDINGTKSVWSEPLIVSMPRNKLLPNTLLLRCLEIFPNAFPVLRYFFRLRYSN